MLQSVSCTAFRGDKQSPNMCAGNAFREGKYNQIMDIAGRIVFDIDWLAQLSLEFVIVTGNVM